MFNIKNIVNKITDRGRESNPNSPGRGPHDDDEPSSQRAEGFLCPRCMKAFASAPELQLHYESLHGEESALDTPGATAAGFYSLHQEVGERYKLPQEGSSGSSGPGISVNLEEVSRITDVAELQKILQEVLENRAVLQSEKEHLEQRAAHLAQLNATFKAACDEGESSQAALKERLKVVEAQLAHRESIDDAAVLRQELVQVQRVMDELNREREQERDALRAELQQLQRERTEETMADVNNILGEKEMEISELKVDLEASKKQIVELTTKLKENDEKMKSVNAELEYLRGQLASISDNCDKEKEALGLELHNACKERDSLKVTLNAIKKESKEFKSSSCRDIEVLQSKLQAVTLTNQQADKKLQSAQAEINLIREEKGILKTEILQKSHMIDALERMKTSCEEKIHELSNALSKSKEKISQLESEHSELVAQIQVGEGATTAIQQLAQENSYLQLKLKEEADQYSRNREESLLAMQDMMKQLGECDKIKHGLQMKLESEQSQMIHMKIKMDGMVDKCRGLQEKLVTKETTIEKLKSINESLKSTIQEKEKEYADLEEKMKQKTVELFQLQGNINGLVHESSEMQNIMSTLHTTNAQLQSEFDKTNKQVKELMVSLSSSEEANKNLEVKLKDLAERFDKKEEECSSLFTEKVRLTREVSALTDKLKTTESQLQTIGIQRASLETSLFEVQKNMAELEGEKKKLEEEKVKEIWALRDRVKAKCEEKLKLTKEVSALTDKLKTTESQLQTVEIQRASLETSLSEVQKNMAELEGEKKELEEEKVKEICGLRDMVKAKSEAIEKHEEAIKIIMAERLSLNEQLESSQRIHEEELKEAKGRCEQLQAELAESVQSKDNLESNLSVEVQKRTDLEGKLEKLSVKLDTTIKENMAKEKSLQASLDEVSGEKLALDVQLEASNAERQALLERCYASASETETLHRTIADLRRKLDESQAALHELGRENQTLQLDIDKLIGRKWAEDSEVNQCTLCHRDFSLILRKHHCRNCGQIFCNECSSKTAPIASNKKPVRVCDACYGELTPK